MKNINTEKFEKHIRNHVSGPWQAWMNQIGELPGVREFVKEEKPKRSKKGKAASETIFHNDNGNVVLDARQFDVDFPDGHIWVYVNTDGVDLEFRYIQFGDAEAAGKCLLEEYEKQLMLDKLMS